MQMKFITPALRFFFEDRFNRLAYSIMALLIVVSYVAIALFVPKEDNVALHYNVYFGIDFIGSWLLSLLVPTVMLVLSVLNATVGLMVWRHDRIIGYFMATGALFVAVLGAVSVILLIVIAQ